jgi:hypothetical protein
MSPHAATDGRRPSSATRTTRSTETCSAEPAGRASIAFGSAWVQSGASALLIIPSVIVPEECNVLINPLIDTLGCARIVGFDVVVDGEAIRLGGRAPEQLQG